MAFIYSLEALNSKEEICIQDIHFPKSEHEALKPRTKIITHRVQDDAERYHQGDYVYAEEIDGNYCFEVSKCQVISRIEDSPYYKELTAGQRTYLSKFSKIAVLTLTKTKYERPYKLSTIKAKYPPKVYEMLAKDPVHSWRARTGIDMIHREPDDAEQQRTVKNWRLLPEKYRKVSDVKCQEIFGVTNEEYWKILKEEKNITSDSVFQWVIGQYRSLFGFDLSRYKLIATKTPRYNNGKVAHTFPIEQFGGCWTYGGTVYLNADLNPVIKFYKLKDTTTEDLKKTLLAHELAHGVYREYATAAFRAKYLKLAKDMQFTTPYLEHVRPNKLEEETFCEFLAAIVCGAVKLDTLPKK